VAVEPDGTSHVTGFFPNQADFGGLVLTNSSGTFRTMSIASNMMRRGNPLWARRRELAGRP